MKRDQIIILLDRFVSGDDTTLNSANQLELLIDEAFPGDEKLQEIVEILACYRPGGGDYLLDESQVRIYLVGAKEYLTQLDDAA